MQKIVLVFDGDDTCWMTEWTYGKARAEFFAFLYSIFQEMTPGLTALKDRYDAIDKILFASWGVKRGRVFFGMLKLYYEIIEHCKERFGEDKLKAIIERRLQHEEKIFSLGDIPFDFYDHKWFEGAEETLAWLKSDSKFVLCLLTCYDANVWRERSKFLGVERYFEKIKVISGRKSPQDFVDISGYSKECGEMMFYTVGNGEPDIFPALEISEQWRGIYIPYSSSAPIFKKQGDSELTIASLDHPRVITLRNILDLRKVDFERFCLRDGP